MNSREFSVVVQGPIHSSPDRKGERDLTIRCLASIRTFLPGAEIVLSTWKAENTDGLDFDVLVKSDDPGTTTFNDVESPPRYNNLNRQIVSTRAGLAAATRDYVIKFRGDLYWESAGVLDYADAITEPLPRGLFGSRVLISSYITVNPRRSLAPFLFCDIVQIGRTEDLRKYWSVPLAPEPETTRWLEGQNSAAFVPLRGCYMRVAPEQYLVLGWLAATGHEIYLDHPRDFSPAKLLLSERILVDNFRVLDPAQLGVRYTERLLLHPTGVLYSAADWDRLSRAYRHAPTRWMAQAGLLARAYWTLGEFFLKSLFTNSVFQNFRPYRWLRDGYRRLFPLP